jgi:hypothetical protein
MSAAGPGSEFVERRASAAKDPAATVEFIEERFAGARTRGVRVAWSRLVRHAEAILTAPTARHGEKPSESHLVVAAVQDDSKASRIVIPDR